MYICGKNVANEYLNGLDEIKCAYIIENFNEHDIIKKLNNKNINTKILKKYELDKLTRENHQGIILEVEDFKYSDVYDFLNKENAFVVILDHIEDPHNFGAIIRTCESAGVDLIIIPKNRSVDVNSTVIKTSVGASKYLPISQITNITSTMKLLKQNGFWIYGADMDGIDYTKQDYKGKVCLVIGNEGNGMSRIVKENCDFIVSIPMNGKINSLNASVATGILVYEIIKGRG